MVLITNPPAEPEPPAWIPPRSLQRDHDHYFGDELVSDAICIWCGLEYGDYSEGS